MAQVILLIGPPGAGKGTQAQFICDKLAIPHISLGDIFRAEAAAKSELGLEIKAVMDTGSYVSDAIAINVIRKRLQDSDCENGYLMDGFPRTVAQAEAFQAILTERAEKLQVIQLEVPEKQLISRIKERAAEGGRSDDTEDVLKRRLEVYLEQTTPLIEYYESQKVLVSVNGVGEIVEVSKRIEECLNSSNSAAINLQ